MLNGVGALFQVGITLFYLMQNEVLAANDYGEIYLILDKFGLQVNRETLMLNLHKEIK
jgi:hypothetical protein